MSSLEIFQNGTSLHPDRIGEPVYQIGKKNADGEYDIVVFDGMSKKEAQARLQELQLVLEQAAGLAEQLTKAKPKAKPKTKPAVKAAVKKKPAVKKASKKAKAKKKPSRKR